MIFSWVTRYCIGVSFFSIWSFSSFFRILLGFPTVCWGPFGFHTRGLLGTPPPGLVAVAEVGLGEDPPGAGVSVPVVPLGERLVRGERLVPLGGLVLRGIRLLLRLSLGEKEVLEEREEGVREERAPLGEVEEVWLRFPRADTGRRFAKWRGSIVTCGEEGPVKGGGRYSEVLLETVYCYHRFV